MTRKTRSVAFFGKAKQRHEERHIKGKHSEIEMVDGSILQVSSRKKDKFLVMLAGI